MNWSKALRTYVIAFISVVAVLAAACGGGTESVPTGPTSSAGFPAPAPTPQPAPSGPGVLSISISPNPVPWSSEPTPNCSLPNNWSYEQVLRNTGGTRLTISDRADFFDGVQVSTRTGLGITLNPGQDTSVTTRWCSGNNIQHTAQTNFMGSDDAGNRISITGPTVRLSPR